jgi:hypothetical protein
VFDDIEDDDRLSLLVTQCDADSVLELRVAIFIRLSR